MQVSSEDRMFAVGPSVRRELVLGLAATLLFFMSALIIPVMGFMVGIFTPLPTLLTFFRQGSPLGYWIPGSAVALGSLLLFYLGMPFGIPYLLEMVLLGLILGTGMRMHWSSEKTVGAAAMVMFVAGSVVFWLVNGGPEGTLVAQVENEMRQAVAVILDHYSFNAADRAQIEESIQQFIPVIVRLLPGFSLATSILIAWVNVLVARRYCRVHHIMPADWPEWTHWKAPEILVWGVIGSGFALLASSGILTIVCLNVLVVLGTVYLLQGFAIVAFFSDKWRIPKFLRAIMYGLLLLQQFATLGAVLMGLFDMWFDFRRLVPKPSPPADSSDE
jgi:uncharacterized protein YybS (DUF2232 family)